MRSICGLLLTILFLTPAFAQPTTAPSTQPLTKDSSIDDILDALDARGKDFKTFTADVKQSDSDTTFADVTSKSGKVWYQDLGDGKARIRVSFDSVQHNDSPPKKDQVDYELIDGKLIYRNYQTHKQDTRQIIRPGEKINLLKLGEGPFPLPIGQPKDEVHKQFDVKKPDATKDDPANTVGLQLTPNPDSRFARKFKWINVWVDLTTHMPLRVATRDHNETMDQTTDLSNVQINPAIKDSDFDLGELKGNWDQTEEAYQD
jgi:outer membrane lipoprotein-sorting protein